MGFILSPYTSFPVSGSVGTAPSAAGCLAYWAMEDNTDLTGNGYTLTSHGETTVAGKISNGKDYDGVNDYNTATAPVTANNTKTINVWFKTPSTMVIDKRCFTVNTRTSVGGFEFTVIPKSASIGEMVYYHTAKTGSLAYTFAMSADTWYMATITTGANGTALEGFINAVSLGTSSCGAQTAEEAFQIGRAVSAYADGIADEVSIFNYQLTQSELDYLYQGGSPGTAQQYPFVTNIVSHPTLTTGLVSYYKFDTDANDSHGSNNGTVSGAVLTTSSGGFIGECYDYDGTNDLITASGADASIEGATAISAFGWINPNSISGKTIFGKGFSNDSDEQFIVYFSTDSKFRLILRTTAGRTLIDTTADAPSTGSWAHVGFTYDGTNVKLYADNVVVASTTTSGALTTGSTYSFIMGQSGSGTFFFDGKIDEVGLWTKALTTDEVSDLYNSGAGLPYN